jgi:hypothetical protein
VIILVSRHHVEHRAAEHFGEVGLRQTESAGDLESLLVGIGARLVEVEVRHSAEALDMELAALFIAIEPPRHEMRAAVFL